jgi:hypothetical protein
MSKKLDSQDTQESQALEIIETTIDNLDLLTRAFDVINEVCREANNPVVNFDSAPPKLLLH